MKHIVLYFSYSKHIFFVLLLISFRFFSFDLYISSLEPNTNIFSYRSRPNDKTCNSHLLSGIRVNDALIHGLNCDLSLDIFSLTTKPPFFLSDFPFVPKHLYFSLTYFLSLDVKRKLFSIVFIVVIVWLNQFSHSTGYTFHYLLAWAEFYILLPYILFIPFSGKF